MESYDVAVVGASVAGCTAATLFGRAGLRVALIERHADAAGFKALCTHYVMSCATPTIRRLGLDTAIEAAGGVRNAIDVRTPWGWVVTPPGLPHGYSIRRHKLDPMLRSLAAGTPGVDLLLGRKVVGLDGGVRVRGLDGGERTLRARLTVGADGAHSTVADLAGAGVRRAPNARFIYFAQFTGVEPTAHARLWMHEPGIAYVMPNDDGVTVLAAMPLKEDLPRFQADREGALLATIRRMPDAPGLDGATRVSKVIGATDYPLVTREAVPAPDVALIGDAALTSDPSQGVGCGWAFQSAEWLVDAVVPALVDGAPLASGLRRYARARAALRGHQWTIEETAKGGPLTVLDRLMLGSAVRDPVLAAHMVAFVNRTVPLRRFLAPSAMARASWVALRGQIPRPASRISVR